MAKQTGTENLAIGALHHALMGMCNRTGHTPDSVFVGLLDYFIGYLNPSLKPEPVEGWKFDKRETPAFHEMFKMTVKLYCQEIPKHGWYDPFGDLYMSIHSGGGGKGQFFTPPSVCDVCAQTAVGDWVEQKGGHTPFGQRIIINDCAAGSGRMPLAGYCAILEKMQKDWGYTPVEAKAKRPYLVCEDLDYNCVKMSAINMAMHGCFGEAVCHDTLQEPDTVRLGYIINEAMYPFPTEIPSIRKETNIDKFVCIRHYRMANNTASDGQKKPAMAKESQQQPTRRNKSTDVLPLDGTAVANERREPQQLSIW